MHVRERRATFAGAVTGLGDAAKWEGAAAALGPLS